MPSHEVKVENGRLLVRAMPATPRSKKPHPPHPLARPVKREPGSIRVLGISTTAQDPAHPRYSTSEALLKVALHYAQEKLKCDAHNSSPGFAE